MTAVLGIVGIFLTCAVPSRGQDDRTIRTSVQLRVGETRVVGVFGGHRPDCVTSTPPTSIQVVQPPKLGVLSWREGAPYTLHNSISGTCENARFFGTAIDYTARAPGADTVTFDVALGNGSVRRIVSVIVGP